ncbi:hypothetical protein FVE85_9238 [Porphyridium purpureum]|uniref:MAGE domain-containing protein n=1 Tax=Porphyridium purpureum TaxID=35688 RepID=A0A5J4YNS3_PORPP|nr:hypothetical protein FVE85_9238 [Porphyridium purpureum]|eukprot:POR0062..scf222_8
MEGEDAAARNWSSVSVDKQNATIRAVCRLLIAEHEKHGVTRKEDVVRLVGETMQKGRVMPEVMRRVRKRMHSALGFDVVEIAIKARPRAAGAHSQAAAAGTAQLTQTQILSQANESFENQLGNNPRTVFVLTSLLPENARACVYSGFDLAKLGLIGVLAWTLIMQPTASLSATALWAHLDKLGIKQKQKHPQLGYSPEYIIDQRLVSAMYLERWKENDKVWYGLGPRIHAEFSTERIIKLIERIMGSKVDDSFKNDLRIRFSAVESPEDG